MTTPNSIWNAIPESSSRNIMVVGASNARALGVEEQQSWVGKIRNMYSRWPSRGRGFRMCAQPDWTTTGTFTKIDTGTDDNGPFGGIRRLSGSGNSQKFTKISGAGDVVKSIVYNDSTGSGNWSYSLDGAAYQASGAATLGDHNLKTLAVSDPVSTIEIRGANAAGTTVQADILGVIIENATGKARWDDVAVDGHRISGDQLSSLDSFTRIGPTGYGGTGNPMGIIEVLDPDILIINDYYNDLSNGTADVNWLTTYQTALNALIDRAQSINCDVCCILYPEGTNSDSNHSFANQTSIRNATASVAASQGVSTADVFTAFGGSLANAVAAGYFQADQTHWSDLGHDVAARTIYKVLAQTNGGGRLKQ